MDEAKAIIEKACKFKIGDIVRSRGTGHKRDGYGGIVIERGLIQLPGGDVSVIYAVRSSGGLGDRAPGACPIQHEIELESAVAETP